MARALHRKFHRAGESQPSNAIGRERQRLFRMAGLISVCCRSHSGGLARLLGRRARNLRRGCPSEKIGVDDPTSQEPHWEMKDLPVNYHLKQSIISPRVFSIIFAHLVLATHGICAVLALNGVVKENKGA